MKLGTGCKWVKVVVRHSLSKASKEPRRHIISSTICRIVNRRSNGSASPSVVQVADQRILLTCGKLVHLRHLSCFFGYEAGNLKQIWQMTNVCIHSPELAVSWLHLCMNNLLLAAGPLNMWVIWNSSFQIGIEKTRNCQATSQIHKTITSNLGTHYNHHNILNTPAMVPRVSKSLIKWFLGHV